MARPDMPPAAPHPDFRGASPDPNSPAPVPDPAPGIRHWGRVYAFVLAVLALLIALFAWLTRIYS